MKHRSDRISLPTMECHDDCGECCGVVLCKTWERQRVEAYAKTHGITPINQGSTCPWFQNGQCAVYEVRPFPCRLFGHVPKMRCPHGLNTNISSAAEREATRVYLADGGMPTSLLHECLGEGWFENLEVALKGQPQ